MKHALRAIPLLALLSLVGALHGCRRGDSATSTTSAAASGSESALDNASAPGAPRSVGVAKVHKPLADWQHGDVKAALEKAGWTIHGATQTKSSMLAIAVNASKGDVKARVNYYNPGGPFWKKTLEKDNAAIHEDGPILVGVVIQGDKNAAQQLLDGLVGK